MCTFLMGYKLNQGCLALEKSNSLCIALNSIQMIEHTFMDRITMDSFLRSRLPSVSWLVCVCTLQSLTIIIIVTYTTCSSRKTIIFMTPMDSFVLYNNLIRCKMSCSSNQSYKRSEVFNYMCKVLLNAFQVPTCDYCFVLS